MKLKPGEYICSECNGSGKDKKYEEYLHEYRDYYKCPKCHGTGKLDWIENVVGKKNIDIDIPSNGVIWLAPSNVAPPNPIIGQAYINSNSNETYVYNGSSWSQVVSMSTPL